ncbi:MAG: hypothetical protein IH586_03115 [Anaerolineaceae bacterium]|nr:hypothetical protein [Anaerolineaceae bacterium]
MVKDQAESIRIDKLAPTSSWLAVSSRRFLHLWVLLFYSLLSILMTWPLALHRRDSVLGGIGDNIYFIFLIRWYQKAWLELHISPFFHPWLNYPQGWSLASTDTSLSTTLFGLPASLIAGPTFGYNFAMLVTFVLSGWAMFFWVRRLTGSTLAGLVAGAVYAFLPYRMAHFLIGHMNLSGTAWFPLFFMGLYDLLRAPRLSWKPLLVTALALGLIAFASLYYLYMALLIAAVFCAGYLWFAERKRLFSKTSGPALWRGLAIKMAVLGLASFPLVFAALLPFLQLNSQGGVADRTISYASMYSASPTDFLLPSTDHFLFGQWVGAHFDRTLWIEASFYIGVVALLLAIVGWRKRSQSSEHAVLFKVALLVILVAFVLSLGTDLHWNNQRVEIPLPAFLQERLQRQTVPLPMPAYLLFRYLPFYSKMRAIMRFGLFVLLFNTMLAGFGAAWLLKNVHSKKRPWLALGLLLLVLFDFYPGPNPNVARVDARPVDYWLAQQPGQGAVAQFPFIQDEDQDQVYNTLVHQKPFIGGFFSANQPEQYLRIKPVLDKYPDPAGTALLRELGVEWVIFDTRQYPNFPSIRQQVEGLGLHYLDTIAGQAVFELHLENAAR